MPNRVHTPPSSQKTPYYPSHTSSQSSSGCLGGEQKNVRLSPRNLSSPSSQGSGTSEKCSTRPKGPLRLSTGKGITTLERIWGPLFDEEGHPTVKLGQLLRGLAVHIIEDYEPRHSMVITPKKMAKYYEDVKLSKEVYSWSAVFDREYRSISRMYRLLECQYHLIQESHDARPDIPGLTPIGFARWVTLLIQAHPEPEFERLRKAVLEMPISNPDDCNERFPKEISRRLFPDHEDHKISNRIEDSMAECVATGNDRRESHEEIPPNCPPRSEKANAIENPRVQQNRRRSVRFADDPIISTSSPANVPSHFDRERKPRSPTASESVIDDTSSPPPSPPSYSVAGERKRHTDPPGGVERLQDGFGRTKPRSESVADPALKLGRTYSTSSAHSARPNTNTRRPAEGPQPGTLFHSRTSSGAGRRHGGPPASYGRSTNNLPPFR